MNKEQILEKYNLDCELWKDETAEQLAKWVKRFKGEEIAVIK